MLRKLKLKNIWINETDKNGNPLVTQKGDPYKRCSIKSEDGVSASMFIGGKFGAKNLEVVKQWKEGDIVEVVLEQKGEYTNFTLPTKTAQLEARIERIEKFLKEKFK